MKVLIIGATGYVGTAVDEALVARGHHTLGAARSEAAHRRLAARGTAGVSADAAKPGTLGPAVRGADAVVYAVSITDDDPWTVEMRALRAIGKSLAGTEKTFVYVSGAWVYGATGSVPATEDSPLDPPRSMMRRAELERESLAMTRIGVRALNVRPGIAYGGAAGIPAMFVQSARERGAATVVGDGANRWATIAITDLGEFVALAIERGRPGRAYNAVNDDQYTMRSIAEAASRGAGANGAVSIVPPELMGHYGECLALDQCVSSQRAKEHLGWNPSRASIIEELERGSYADAIIA